MTIEHAPPESLGGGPVCLTCKECNSTAGHTVDGHMKKRENVFGLLQGRMDVSRPALLHVGEVRAIVDYYHGAAGVLISGVPKANHPSALSQLQSEIEGSLGRGVETSFGVSLYRDQYENRLAQVGWLRAAYLVAFAVFGYRYVFQKKLEPVRRQLAEPKSILIDPFSVILPEAKADERRFMLVAEPDYLRGIAVQMGRCVVFLPWLVEGLYEALAQQNRSGPSFQAQLKVEHGPWPTEPMHLLDFDQVPGVEITPETDPA